MNDLEFSAWILATALMMSIACIHANIKIRLKEEPELKDIITSDTLDLITCSLWAYFYYLTNS